MGSGLTRTAFFSASPVYTGELFQGSYRLRQQPRTDDRSSNNHLITSGSLLAEKNLNNAHNRYSNADIGSYHSSSTSCLFNIRRAGNSPGDDIRVLRISVGIENKCISVDEGSRSVLKYKTPHFRAKATVEIPRRLTTNQRIEVGWIQVCHSMQCVNVYGQEGLTSWEFPEIVLGKFEMVSDSDGKRYPWYGTKHEVHVIDGPTDDTRSVTVVMHDNFFPQITWHIPAKGYSREPRLTHIYRKQKFFTFLAVRRVDHATAAPVDTPRAAKDGQLQVLHAVEWSMEVDIAVDPTLPIGYRVKSVSPRTQEEVAILDVENHSLLRDYALEGPNANASQALVWRPFSDSAARRPSVVVKPLQTTVPLDTYLDRTREFGRKLSRKWVEQKHVLM